MVAKGLVERDRAARLSLTVQGRAALTTLLNTTLKEQERNLEK
jgi:DNA-binding MarR family transcriptional regulator